MTRWKTLPPATTFGSCTLVADGLTITSPASLSDGSTALVSPEHVGPMTPRILVSASYLAAWPGAWAGSPWVSKSLRTKLYLLCLALACLIATDAPLRLLMPRLALAPVRGPTNAKATVVLPLVLDLLPPPPHAARTTDATARTARTRRAPFFLRRMVDVPFVPALPGGSMSQTSD